MTKKLADSPSARRRVQSMHRAAANIRFYGKLTLSADRFEPATNSKASTRFLSRAVYAFSAEPLRKQSLGRRANSSSGGRRSVSSGLICLCKSPISGVSPRPPPLLSTASFPLAFVSRRICAGTLLTKGNRELFKRCHKSKSDRGFGFNGELRDGTVSFNLARISRGTMRRLIGTTHSG